MKKTQAVILAAGLGKRMKSSLPKVIHTVLGKPLIRFVVDSVLQAGVEKVTVVVGHGGEKVREALEGYPVVFAVQEEQLGTGHAVASALDTLHLSSPETIVLCGDAPLISPVTLRKMVRRHRKEKAVVTLLTAYLEDPSGYGRVVRSPSGEVAKIVEEKDASPEEREVNEVNSGTYVFDTAYLMEGVKTLSRDNAQGEYYLTDLVYRAFSEEKRVVALVSDDPDEILGVNSRQDLAQVAGIVALRKAEELMEKGVTLEDPYGTYVAPDVKVGPDTVIEPGVVIKGKTRIGKGVFIGAGCYIEDSRIGDGATLRPYSVVTESVVGRGVRVGPFAHLRPGTELKEGVHIGNFVEVKNSRVGEGSKANHLTYIGDATVGKKVNVGAGTITCNYDGLKKHRTVIGDGAFIGSNTELVAPVSVGKGALVGAGTTVTEDVPPFSLALSRVRQKNIKSWVREKMPDLLRKSGLLKDDEGRK
ncbi:MAG: UDP-N-acetylglucosamine diphosphorylase/glucosamine-1-phosphate N-acetyltransferase [Deltaproteobacteria bacterium]|nr:MAG: UDP-N-acetylglucosamine diphosphorylase/glucosamine-1-phosphate N-acetyltransferase [Deltaproteobacteria bacterium]